MQDWYGKDMISSVGRTGNVGSVQRSKTLCTSRTSIAQADAATREFKHRECTYHNCIQNVFSSLDLLLAQLARLRTSNMFHLLLLCVVIRTP